MTGIPDRPRTLVTGASGFIGRHLCDTLNARSIPARRALRTRRGLAGDDDCLVGDVGPGTDWSRAVEGISVVVHLAGRAHTREGSEDVFQRVNAGGTGSLARAAKAAGVRRLVYVSSLGVLGDLSDPAGHSDASVPRPHNAYSRSKLAGEEAALEAAGDGFEVVIVRPPLTYGSHVGASFLRLMRVIDQQWPLPFGAVSNRRSFISVWNLCDFLVHVSGHPLAVRRPWLVSDADDLSTPDLLRRLARDMGRPVRLPRVPVGLLKVAADLSGQQAQFRQLCGSLFVDSRATIDELGWQPPVSVDEGLHRTAEWYREARELAGGRAGTALRANP